ncbi:hypothetical protein PFMALIP_06059 [Plasmodium falciparum MaliPS096_E11]|uniref:Surface antigen n=1 Tax=Plasmodium falciparum MaliPS096_E11 TaxID=1036727 RepID=A0A024WFQ5_PLAFA|nr:hypothetical protein PFMALIP_06059 [Plasmodium falciparum MaliPS096_E11]
MKIHYINIFLLALPLNILVNNQRNHKKNIFRTPKIKPTKTYRTLCECELYAPSNYDNDPEMKELIENFNHQTSDRFKEYYERMQDKRQKCKEQCDKEIQKIVLKDKLEKELTQKISTLETNIDTNDMPTCVCKKSLADKTEKFCLNCGKTMGAVAPAWGLVSGLGYAGWLNAAMIAAEKAGVDAGIVAAIDVLKDSFGIDELSGVPLKTILNANNFKNTTFYILNIQKEYDKVCSVPEGTDKLLCLVKGKQSVKYIAGNAQKAVSAASDKATEITTEEVAKITSASSTYSTAIIASVVAILVIVLFMVIIYLILGYRRKKKMKKKMQYIKLLKE